MNQGLHRPRRRLSKGMYILPSLFTTANMALGYYAILEIMHAAAIEYLAPRQCGEGDRIRGAVRRARRTHRAHDRHDQRFRPRARFLADAITFGVAPAMLAWTWGFHLMPPVMLSAGTWHIKLTQLGAIASFLFLIAGASRLARFNISSNPQPSNPGRPGQEIFCRNADSGGSRRHCGRSALRGGRSARGCLYGSRVVRHGHDRGLSDGQHVALLQFQGH